MKLTSVSSLYKQTQTSKIMIGEKVYFMNWRAKQKSVLNYANDDRFLLIESDMSPF